MRHLAKRHMVAGRSNEDMSWPLGLYSHRTVVRLSEPSVQDTPLQSV
jgi:hypothetical protein